MNSIEDINDQLKRWRRILLLLGIVGAAICVAGALYRPEQFFVSYLFAFFYWGGLSLGCAAMLMIHSMVGGAWGFGVRRIMEAAAWPLLFMAVFFVPLFLGTKHLYEWTDPEVSAHLGSKALYLNLPFFWGRAIVYLAVWALLAFLLTFWSARIDRTEDPKLSVRLMRLSALGLILHVLTVTFAAFDWVMSLDYHWFSSIFGVIFLVGQGLSGLAFSIVVLSWLSPRLAHPIDATRAPLIDIGNLMMAGTVLWAYVSFSQFLIIWSGNLAEEVPWYIDRSNGGWEWVAVALILLHFALPFFLLLMRDIKKNIKLLSGVACIILVMHMVDLFWLIMPTYQHRYADRPLSVHWLDVVTFVAFGAVWLTIVLFRLPSRLFAPKSELILPEGAH